MSRHEFKSKLVLKILDNLFFKILLGIHVSLDLTMLNCLHMEYLRLKTGLQIFLSAEVHLCDSKA